MYQNLFAPKVGGDEAIIGALSDMDLTVPQDEHMIDCEVNDDDLLGMDLMEMENGNSSRDVVSKVATRDSLNISKSLKASKKMGAPLGFHNKKAEVLRRGSPRQRSPKPTDRSNHGDAGKERKKRHGSSKRARNKFITQGCLMGSKNTSKHH